MPRKISLSQEQESATRPTINVVVQANAGTGKTFVLVRRLLRILFRDTAPADAAKPSGILCLTYTNAGAAEMRNRILASLAEWARADDDGLRDLLNGISHNNPPAGEDLALARKIFYNFIDNPDILKIQTVHSFCQDILYRFPVEAGLPLAWRLVSGAEQKRLLKETFSELMSSNTGGEAAQNAFENILGMTSEYSLDNLLASIADQYQRILLLKRNNKTISQIIEKTRYFLGLDNPPPRPDFDGDIGLILTQTGEIRKKLQPKLASVASEVYEWNQYEKNLAIFQNSADFLILCDAFANKYMELKHRRGLLDFDDLLHHTMALFSDQKTMGQVLSQLDFNLRHILIDESQDNSPSMWDIIFAMLSDFFTAGEADNPRTLFAVGDIKQSIFSFQGANPAEFAAIPGKISGIAENGRRQYETVPLLESRRATGAILTAIDFFFNNANLKGFPKNILHKCWRQGEFGMVEIHPLFEKSADEELFATRKKYAASIADKIESIIKNENIPENDIMVLLQRRNPFSDMLIRELKRKNIKTTGSDRIILPNYPAIRDMLNLIRFAINPNDRTGDAALAFVLRGPAVGFSEQRLLDLCANRDLARPLWHALKEKEPAVYSELSDIAAMSNLPPYGFLSEIMNRYRAKIIAALGRQVIDPLDEFMTLALSYERTRFGGLAGFLRWFLDGENEIRRDMESDAGVRILTTHSSKGLEAPVVFLIDTTRNPNSPTPQRPFNVLNPADDAFVCRSAGLSSNRLDAAKDTDLARRTEEYWRLLYVAMTRARDRLYIFGCDERVRNESWHSKLCEVMRNMPGASTSEDGIITVSDGVSAAKKTPENNAKTPDAHTLILPHKSLKEEDKNHITDDLSISDFMREFNKKYAMDHGSDIHKKLQFLSLNDGGEMADKIKQNLNIAKFWAAGSRAEVPIAGTTGGRFHSLRLDRMIETEGEVLFLDYKTDSTRARRDAYSDKMKLYAELLKRIYPDKRIRGHILWLNEWELEEIKL